jgi:hypothetical protein
MKAAIVPFESRHLALLSLSLSLSLREFRQTEELKIGGKVCVTRWGGVRGVIWSLEEVV